LLLKPFDTHIRLRHHSRKALTKTHYF